MLWIDYNSDYVRNATVQPDEIVTWSVVDNGSGEQYNTLRSTAGGERAGAGADPGVRPGVLLPDRAPSDDPADCLATPLSAADAAQHRLITVDLRVRLAGRHRSGDRSDTSFTERIRNVS